MLCRRLGARRSPWLAEGEVKWNQVDLADRLSHLPRTNANVTKGRAGEVFSAAKLTRDSRVGPEGQGPVLQYRSMQLVAS